MKKVVLITFVINIAILGYVVHHVLTTVPTKTIVETEVEKTCNDEKAATKFLYQEATTLCKGKFSGQLLSNSDTNSTVYCN